MISKYVSEFDKNKKKQLLKIKKEEIIKKRLNKFLEDKDIEVDEELNEDVLKEKDLESIFNAIEQVEKVIKNLIGSIGVTSPIISTLIETVIKMEKMVSAGYEPPSDEEEKVTEEEEKKDEENKVTLETSTDTEVDIPSEDVVEESEEESEEELEDLENIPTGQDDSFLDTLDELTAGEEIPRDFEDKPEDEEDIEECYDKKKK